MSCILRYQGVQLILAYSWTRSAALVAGKGRGGMFLLHEMSSLIFSEKKKKKKSKCKISFAAVMISTLRVKFFFFFVLFFFRMRI